jgi:transcriptional regulator with XRE-family HTH domain
MSLADQIKKYRRQKGLSQDKLARLAGIAFSTLAKIEAGSARQPTFDTIAKIAKGLGVSLDELGSGKTKQPKGLS